MPQTVSHSGSWQATLIVGGYTTSYTWMSHYLTVSWLGGSYELHGMIPFTVAGEYGSDVDPLRVVSVGALPSGAPRSLFLNYLTGYWLNPSFTSANSESRLVLHLCGADGTAQPLCKSEGFAGYAPYENMTYPAKGTNLISEPSPCASVGLPENGVGFWTGGTYFQTNGITYCIHGYTNN